MKTSAILIGVGAAMAAAQDITYPSGFPDCGKTCINNMLNQASELGCTDVAPSCLCTKQNFIYGVRDCATESCQDQSLAQQVIQYGSQYCASVGVDVSGIPTATGTNPTASTTVLATASPTNNPIVVRLLNSYPVLTSLLTKSKGTTQESNSNGATGSIPISTATFETSFTASGSAIESTVTSTIFSGEASSSGTVASGSESGSGTASVIESTTTTNGSTLATTTTGTEAASSQASESGSSESRTGSSSESHSSTSNPAAQRTAAPAGFIAAAGLAALML
ncbi:hypothetical protein F4805DRAFT_160661 [Annulohypoxylon moriforme]|nr:hypothetical protein F4805DRAFT_160661 [Annulohypoxylon moriforme]